MLKQTEEKVKGDEKVKIGKATDGTATKKKTSLG